MRNTENINGPSKSTDKLPEPGRMIIEALERKGWSQYKLAKISGIAVGAVWNYIHGTRVNVSINAILRLAIILGIDPYELACAFTRYRVDKGLEELMGSIKARKKEDRCIKKKNKK